MFCKMYLKKKSIWFFFLISLIPPPKKEGGRLNEEQLLKQVVLFILIFLFFYFSFCLSFLTEHKTWRKQLLSNYRFHHFTFSLVIGFINLFVFWHITKALDVFHYTSNIELFYLALLRISAFVKCNWWQLSMFHRFFSVLCSSKIWILKHLMTNGRILKKKIFCLQLFIVLIWRIHNFIACFYGKIPQY